MLNVLKNIPLIENILVSGKDGTMAMVIDNQRAMGYLCNQSLVLAIFIEGSLDLPIEILNHITLLLGASPDIHDYSLHLSPEGGWLCCWYSRDTNAEIMSKEIEKQLALTRYLQNIISRRWHTCLDGK